MTNSTKSDNLQNENNPPASHSKIEDALAMIIGTFMIGFALLLMQSSHTLTGGTAGLALLVHYVTDIRFGVLFFLFNLPFYYLAYKQLGMAMVIKTFIAVGLLSLMTELHPMFIDIGDIQPLYGTILANVFFGVGFLILFRHRASLGGFNLFALFMQERYQIPAGKVQMAMDVSVLIASFAFVNWQLLLISILGAVILNMIIATNHRTDRYVAR
ncbi:MAG: YitT family protein [Pasteurella sp.]|nr:YitT family protein [Pasteurella sp.]